MARFIPVDGWGFQPVPKGMKLGYSLAHNYAEYVGVKARKDDTVNPKYQYPKVYLMKKKTEEYMALSDLRRQMLDEGKKVEGSWDDDEEYRLQKAKNYDYLFITQHEMNEFQLLSDLEAEEDIDKWNQKWHDIEFVKECYGRPALLQQKELIKDTVWAPDEWFPIIGREGGIDLDRGGDTPFTVWGDKVKGSWKRIDVASGWGQAGKKKHPQKLNTPEKLDAWAEWTNRYLMKNAICSNGRLYIAHEQKKGYNKRRGTWKTTYYPFLYMFDFASLRPMLKLKGVLDARSYESDGYHGYGQTRTTRSLRWEINYEDIEISKWQDILEEWIEYTQPLSERLPFMRTYRCWSRLKTKNDTVKGFQVDTKMHQNTYGDYMADKITLPIYRELLMVWIPDKALDFSFYQTGIVNSIPPISAQEEWNNVRQ